MLLFFNSGYVLVLLTILDRRPNAVEQQVRIWAGVGGAVADFADNYGNQQAHAYGDNKPKGRVPRVRHAVQEVEFILSG